MLFDYFEVVLTADGLQFIPVIEYQGNLRELASQSDDSHRVPLPLLPPDEPRAPTAILTPAKRDALLACLNGGTLHKRCDVWTVPSGSTDGGKTISGVTVADLRVRFKTSSRITELSQHEANGREFQEREGVAIEIFPVLGEAAATVEPRNSAFDQRLYNVAKNRSI